MAITGALGTGVPEVSRMVAGFLGLPCLDDVVPALVAAELDIPLHEAAEFDGRLPSGVGTAAAAVDMFGPLPGLSLWSIEVNAKAADVHRVTAELLRREARSGAVVVGRGAPHVLVDDPRVLKVRLVGDRRSRIRSVATECGLGERDVARLVRRADRREAAYVRAVHRRRIDDRRVHDLVIDVAGQSSAAIAGTIVETVLIPVR